MSSRQEKRRKQREIDAYKLREMDEPNKRMVDASNINQEQLYASICDAIELNMQLGITKIDVITKDGKIIVQPRRQTGGIE